MITFRQNGNFKNTERFLAKAGNSDYLSILNEYGRKGVLALSSATPVDSGETANSWGFEIKKTKNKGASIIWTNSNVTNSVPVAILIQYGHGTINGGYVQGRDFINPALRPIFDKIAEDIWKEVNNL